MNVKYIGSWGDYSGYGEANRVIIQALVEAGVSLSTQRESFVTEQSYYGKAYQIAAQYENSNIPYFIKIIHLTPNLYIKHLEPMKYHIGHLFWETDRIPRLWVWNCNRMDEIWTGSEHNKEALIRSGVRVPIFVFPQPIDTLPQEYKPFKLYDFEGYLFYSMFEFIERKNPKALLKAYWEEFQGGEKVGLLLKTYRQNFTYNNKKYIEDKIKNWKLELKLPTFPRVFLYEELMTDPEIQRLHETGDCFVSSHRGEGWGRPQMEAINHAKLVISTNCGGIHEYLNKENSLLCEWLPARVTLDNLSESYLDDQNWAEIDNTQLRKNMRWAYDNPRKAEQLGRNAKKFVDERFNLKTVGELMKRRLEAIGI